MKLIEFVKKHYLLMSMFLIFVILIGYLVISLIFKEDRTKTLVEIEKDDKLKFVIDEKEYYIF